MWRMVSARSPWTYGFPSAIHADADLMGTRGIDGSRRRSAGPAALPLHCAPQGLNDAAYAASEIMSSIDSFSTTGFIRALPAPARSPARKS
jgi:hypothetical protein